MEIVKPYKVGSYWTNLIDSATGESFNFEEVTTWWDGTPMDDSKCDGTIYRKLPVSVGGGYVKRKYTGSASVLWFGADPTGTTDSKAAINTALRICPDVLIPKGNYLIQVTQSTASGGIIMQNNSKLVFEEGATVFCQDNSFAHYAIIGISNKSNVVISGKGKIVGDKDTHTGVDGERGMGVWLHNCRNISISDVSISQCWGDGIYMGSDQNPLGNLGAVDVSINNVVCDSNRRQGVSIVCGKGITIANSSFLNTSGTPPQAGIDVEPNQYQQVEQLAIENCRFEGNVGSGIELASYSVNTYIREVVVRGCTLKNNVILVTTGLVEIPDGEITNVVIIDTSIEVSTRDRAIRLNGRIDNLVISNCHLTASETTGTANGILVETSKGGNILVANCTVTNFPNAAVRVINSENVTVCGGTYLSGTTRAAYVTGECSNIVIDSCILSATDTNAIVYGGSITDSAITNNRIISAGVTPIQVNGAPKRIHVAKNNIVGFTGTSGLYAAISITGTTTDSIIEGNVINSGLGIFTFGVNVGTTATNNQVHDNSFVGTFTTNNINILGPNNTLYPNLSTSEGGSVTLNYDQTSSVNSLGVRFFLNADTILPVSTAFPFSTSTGATGYPSVFGGGLVIQRTPNDSTGRIMLWKDNSNSDSIYVRGGTQPFKKLIKEGDVVASADTAASISGTFSQAEVQAILTELRDLKTKMRAAGLLAT